MKYVIPLFLLIADASLGAAGQQASGLYGVVRDSTGLPMEGVEVVLTGPAGMATVTSMQDGAYQFQVMEAGPYQLSARKTGFREWIRGVTLESGGSLAMDIDMQPGYAETLIVTASRARESLITAPAAVAVLGNQEIETSAADTFADLLSGVPGLNITQFGARDININTRSSTGILSNSMLVMVDGRSFVQPFYGAVYWDLMTMTKDEIDQIEVLRTPASALWGANALSGVINIRTKSPRQIEGLRGHLGFGERGTKSAGVMWADSTDRLSYKLSGSYFEQEPWDRDNVLPDGSPMPSAAIFENRGTKQPKLDVRVDWDADRRRVWSIRGGVAGANGLIHSALGPAEFASGSYSSYLELDHRSDDLDIKLYWNRLDVPFRIVLFGLDEDATNDTFVSEATRRLKVGERHSLTFGGSLRLDRFDITIAPRDRGRLDAAAFVEGKVSVSPNLSLVVGGRLDKFDTTDAVFAPRLGLVTIGDISRGVQVDDIRPAPRPQPSQLDGQQVFVQCRTCHDSMAAASANLSLRNIVGRPVASIPGYPYSTTLKTMGGLWTEGRLDAFLADPDTTAPGSLMGPGRVPDADERRALIDFLKTYK